MNLIKTFTLLFLAVISNLNTSCTRKTDSTVDSDIIIVDYNNAQVVNLDMYYDFSKAKIIQFKSNDTLVLSNRLEIIIENDNIFVFDRSITQLYRFDINGKLINKIGVKGRGVSEYNNADFFMVDKQDSIVDILCDSGTKIKTYDYYGNFIKSFNTPFVTSSFARLNPNLYYYYIGYYGSKTNERLFLSDTSEVINSFLKLKTNAFDAIEQNFTSLGDYGLFRETFFPSIYKYDSTGISEFIRFDFGNCEINEDELRKVEDPYKFFEDINNRGFCTTLEVQWGNEIIAVSTLYQKDYSFNRAHFYINSADSSYFKVSDSKHDTSLAKFFNQLQIVHIDNHDYGYYMTCPYSLNELLKQKPELFSENFDFDVEGNPVIIVIPLNSKGNIASLKPNKYECIMLQY